MHTAVWLLVAPEYLYTIHIVNLVRAATADKEYTNSTYTMCIVCWT